MEKSHKQIEEEGIGKENEKENGKLIDNDDRNNMNMIFIKTQSSVNVNTFHKNYSKRKYIKRRIHSVL